MITNLTHILFSGIVTTIIGITTYKLGIIDVLGLIAAESVGLIIIVFGGWEFFIILLTFLVIAGIFTKYKYNEKKIMGMAEGKNGVRSWQNVLANSVVASFFAIAYGLFPSSKALMAGFLGAISTSMADTLATEIGLLSHYEPRLITKLSSRVKAGTSGGITLLGEVASLFGVLLIASIAWGVGFTNPSIVSILVSMGAGFLGCTFDSYLGATVQATFKCTVCGKETEKTKHCQKATVHVNGKKVMDNNIVNLISTIFGASIAFLIHLVIPF
jgi:uncharacterized protein (TIGR00297 family)